MKRLSCVVGFAFALGAVAPLLADELPSHIDVVIVSASSAGCVQFRFGSACQFRFGEKQFQQTLG